MNPEKPWHLAAAELLDSLEHDYELAPVAVEGMFLDAAPTLLMAALAERARLLEYVTARNAAIESIKALAAERDAALTKLAEAEGFIHANTTKMADGSRECRGCQAKLAKLAAAEERVRELQSGFAQGRGSKASAAVAYGAAAERQAIVAWLRSEAEPPMDMDQREAINDLINGIVRGAHRGES
jgi:hypothetical protein